MSATATDYVRAIIVLRLESDRLDDFITVEWMEIDALKAGLAGFFNNTIESGGYRVPELCAVRNEIVDFIVDSKAFDVRGTDFTGIWCRINGSETNNLIDFYQKSNESGRLLHSLGGGATRNALAKSAEEFGWQRIGEGLPDHSLEDVFSSDELAPASDRIVTFRDNQQALLEEPVSDLIRAVENENSINGEPGLRELVLGRLKAGRELIRAGVFSTRSFYLTMVVGLQMLIEKYKDHAIGAAAGNLLALIIEAIKAS